VTVRGRRVLVTGAGGFLGGAVVRRLVELGAHVRALVGPRPAPDLTPPPPGVAALYGDVEDPRAVDRALGGALDGALDEIERVYHLAGPPSVAASFAAPASYLRVHAAGTAAVLERCIAARVPLVYVSSAEVYAEAPGPVAEDAPRVPRSPYGVAKLAAEQVLELCAAGAVAATIVRPFSVYGPGASPRSVVAEIAAAVARGEPPCVADPRPVRDYVYVTDAAAAIVRCGERGASGVRAPDVRVPDVRAYNVASGRGVSIEELARAALRVAGRSELAIRRRAGDRPAGALVLARVGDPARARDELGFQAAVALEDGLERTLRAWREEARQT
jgi:nucleoside-diphosphate-sugar epimerase